MKDGLGKGYKKSDGKWQYRAIAFQGEVINPDGTKKTEVFVLDLPEDLTKANPENRCRAQLPQGQMRPQI
jgi:hypothetical protein